MIALRQNAVGLNKTASKLSRNGATEMKKWKVRNGQLVELSEAEVKQAEPYVSEQLEELPVPLNSFIPGWYIGMTEEEEQKLRDLFLRS